MNIKNKKIKIERIAPGVTNNPDNGILKGEKIKTSDVKQTMKLLDNLYTYKPMDKTKAKPHCSCRLDKSEKAHDHVKLKITELNENNACKNCGHEVIWFKD